MRVSNKKIGREGANLGGDRIVDAIGVSMDLGCSGSGALVVRVGYDFELVEKLWPGRYPVWIRNRRWSPFGAGVPRSRPHERQACGEVSVFAVVDAANRFHIGN
jgi:hypothetical protein